MTSCNYRREKKINNESFEIADANDLNLSYKLVDDNIFTPKCVSCHGTAGGVFLGSYESIVKNLQKIERVAIQEKTMPPMAPLSESERNLLSTWIKAGAPEHEGLGVINENPIPTPPAPLIEAQFDSIKINIFDSKCIVCHSPTGTARDVLLNTKEDLLDSPRDLVIPRNSQESGLYIAVSRTDSGMMPPPDSGIPPLTLNEIDIIKQWIDNGAEQ
ncbi:MAG: hypothetical protein HQK51_03985 [Oligoflexia bacterium]|nr:hypothetical protein [Oligoflexia bacterium]